LAVPQTPTVLAPPLVQSALMQQPVEGTQRLVPGQFLKPLLQAMWHPVVGSQVAEPFAAGVGHEMQLAVQKLVLVSDWQIPPQLCVPVPHMPLQAFEVGMQLPAQSLVVLVHAGTQASPSQVTLPPPGATHAEHDVPSLGPQVATAMLSTHLPLHRWKPLLHCTAQTPLTQVAVPLESPGQLTQAAPQPVGSLSPAQRALLPVPHTWVPAPHVNEQAVPLQLEVAPVGAAHAAHDVPQELVLVFDAQMPLQSCVPVPHTPAHDALPSMHVPAHSLVPAGQAGMHAVPSQVTLPPVGLMQAVHETVPQLPVSMLLTHLAPHRW
jgi:hypothetical protein